VFGDLFAFVVIVVIAFFAFFFVETVIDKHYIFLRLLVFLLLFMDENYMTTLSYTLYKENN
jgi:hypothetical protein